MAILKEIGEETILNKWLMPSHGYCPKCTEEVYKEMRGDIMKVLVVDDEPSVCALLKIILETAGYKVKIEHDGKSASTLLKHDSDDYVIIFLDMIIPGMDGEAILTELERTNPDKRVIVLSGDPRKLEDAQKHANVVKVINKPWSMQEIQSVLDWLKEFQNSSLVEAWLERAVIEQVTRHDKVAMEDIAAALDITLEKAQSLYSSLLKSKRIGGK